jgi:ABC-2 type transport system permease protein
VSELLQVAGFEYRRHVFQRRFLVATLGMPLFVGAMVALSVVASERLESDARAPWATVGAPALPGASVELADRSDAEARLMAGEIDGYVVPEAGGRAYVRSVADAPPALRQALRERALSAVLAGAPAAARAALETPSEVRHLVLSTGSDRPVTGTNLAFMIGSAFLMPMVFTVAVLFSTTFLVLAITEEKENRLMEMLVTSSRPRDLIGGKVLGLGALSLTQTGVWLVSLAALGLVVAERSGLDVVGSLPWRAAAYSVPFFVLGYLLYAAAMAGIGVAVGQSREAQQVAGFVSLALALPFMLASFLLFRPASPAAVALSLFPPTAPVAMPMRLALSVVPAREMALALVLLAASVWLAVHAVARIFRASMLLYGQRVSLRQLAAAFRG